LSRSTASWCRGASTRSRGQAARSLFASIPRIDDGVITAGFLFDVQVRFESDDAFEGILRTYAIGGFADITLIEVRPC
jgi:hypothetical protein